MVSVILTGFFCNFSHYSMTSNLCMLSGTFSSPDSMQSIVLLYSKNSHEGTGCYCSTDNTCYVRAHCMHQKEVGRICLRTDLLGYTGCHRNGRYTCGTDQRIDLAAGKLAHELTEENTACGTERECNQTKGNDLQGITCSGMPLHWWMLLRKYQAG